MGFDEQHLGKLLNSMDCSEEKIAEATTYMLNYIENYQLIIKMWYHFFTTTKLSDVKLGLFYLAHELMFQSYIHKKDKYIIAFGCFMEEIIHILIKSFGDELDFVNKLLKIIEYWEKKMYFSYNFISKLKNILLTKKNQIYQNEPGIRIKETLKNEEVQKVMRNKLARQGLILSVEQANIKTLNDKINYEKINSLLVDNDINNYKKREIKKYETKLKALRELFINDLVKREKYMIDLTNNISSEKETFFDIVREENKDKDANNEK